MKAAGICLGASRISVAVVRSVPLNNGGTAFEIIQTNTKTHDGDLVNVLQTMLSEIKQAGVEKIAVTGRKFRDLVNFPSVAEAEAVELAYGHLEHKYPACDGIVSAGGESFLAYQLSGGQIVNVFTGNKCASGTGEFFLQQTKRMNLGVEEALALAKSDDPYSVAGRCSVFCKSDCTHALNKGADKGKVVAGLCKMMAGKIQELLARCQSSNILLIGGTTQNTVMLEYVKKELDSGRSVRVADEACYFEAFGAAVWAFENGSLAADFFAGQDVIKNDGQKSAFTFLPAISDYQDKVSFKTIAKASGGGGDRCIVGLDVGSTTTKAVVVRQADNAILGSIYLRTNGDPVKAARECYTALTEQVGGNVVIEGLGVTGSGRQIAGLHADTEGVVNEIVAHATAAVYFDPEVDTIFEIGGQDAKYTYITNRVASDYAMNEACSAGTGSFLEESAKETMGIDTLEIADIALASKKPPNFNDQCAAFIGSDIKTAIQEGIGREDIVGGLVYSICQNYANRVKGNRMVGKKIFMQGGVCYNRAVPIAMAALIGAEIVVPPEPGLMGAFGVALEVQRKIEMGLIAPKAFNLKELADRRISYGKPFICSGGKERCDRKCSINIIEINGDRYPFGGACNKYTNLRRKIEYDIEELDLVRIREYLIFEKYAGEEGANPEAKRIGIPKSLLVNSLYPLYYNFFSALGLNVVLGEVADLAGRERRGAAFCYPVELAHGFVADLVNKNVDYVFLPSVTGMQVENGIDCSVTCPLVQGEPYYLRTAFPEASPKMLSPILDFSRGYAHMTKEFVQIGSQLGFGRKASIKAYKAAFERQIACQREMKEIGRAAIEQLEAEPERTAIVLFGRPYNALTKDGNIGIPSKFASRGYLIIPWDFLDFAGEEPYYRMFWSMGQMLLKTARLVEKHPQLFPTYVTNFSCGPDSFLLGYFRDLMGQKPSLTLELDSHTADAGVDTRIEAFLDVARGYIELCKLAAATDTSDDFPGLSTEFKNGKVLILDSAGNKYDLRDENVIVRIPSMGNTATRLLAATLRRIGVKASHLPPPTETELTLGRANSTCKECLPFTLVAGSILGDAVKQDGNKVLVYFFADSSGPCRFGQYHVQMQNILRKNKLNNVAVLPLTSDNGYSGLGVGFQLRAWQSVVLAEVLDDIYSALIVLACDKEEALALYEQSVARIEQAVAGTSWRGLKKVLRSEAEFLAKIPLKGSLDTAVKAAILGEIYVRSDSLSRQYLVERLAEKGIIAKVAAVTEFVYFCDYILEKAIYHVKSSLAERTLSAIKRYFKQYFERTVKEIMAGSGLYDGHALDIPQIVNNVKHIIEPHFTAGDTVLTIGAALTDIVDEVAGVISIGPFGCMPCRVSEAILGETIDTEKPNVAKDKKVVEYVMKEHPALPFLAIESDGNPFPQIIEAKLEIFCMQVARVHQAMLAAKS